MKLKKIIFVALIVALSPVVAYCWNAGITADYYNTNGVTIGVIDYHSDPFTSFYNGGYFPSLMHSLSKYGVLSPGAGNAKVKSNGDIKRPSDVIWIDASDLPDLNVKKASIESKISYEDLKSILESKPTEYPNLFDALTKPDTFDLRTEDADNLARLQVGNKVVCHDGVLRAVGKVVVNGPGYFTPKVPTTFVTPSGVSGFNYRSNSTYGSYPAPETRHKYSVQIYYDTGSPTLTPDRIPRTQPEFAAKLANTNSVPVESDVFTDTYGAEIDDFIKDNPNVVHFMDPSGNELGIPDSATQYEIDRAKAIAAQQEATAAAQQAATNARSRADAARAAANAAAAAAAADPNNAALAAAAAAAESAAAAAEAAADAAEAAAAKAEAEEADEESALDSVGGPGDPGSYQGGEESSDFGTRFDEFITKMKGTNLFTLPQQMIGGVPSGGESTMLVNFGRYGSFTYDFSSWGNIFVIIRSILMVCMSIYCFKIITLKGGSG